MAKQLGIQKLKKKLDSIFSRWVRFSAADSRGMVKCFTCDYIEFVKKLQNGHYVPRQHVMTRFLPDNCRPQCFICNMRYGGRPQEFRERLIEELGEERVVEVEQLRHSRESLDRFALEAMIKDYNGRLAELPEFY